MSQSQRSKKKKTLAEPQRAIDNMKKITGSWDGREIFREETSQEKIQRELGEGADKVANIFINLNER